MLVFCLVLWVTRVVSQLLVYSHFAYVKHFIWVCSLPEYGPNARGAVPGMSSDRGVRVGVHSVYGYVTANRWCWFNLVSLLAFTCREATTILSEPMFISGANAQALTP